MLPDVALSRFILGFQVLLWSLAYLYGAWGQNYLREHAGFAVSMAAGFTLLAGFIWTGNYLNKRLMKHIPGYNPTTN